MEKAQKMSILQNERLAYVSILCFFEMPTHPLLRKKNLSCVMGHHQPTLHNLAQLFACFVRSQINRVFLLLKYEKKKFNKRGVHLYIPFHDLKSSKDDALILRQEKSLHL
jgi:hypothetical protein